MTMPNFLDRSVEMKLERMVVMWLVRVADSHGYKARYVFDGEERVDTLSEKEVLDTVFSVDDSRIYFRKDDDKKAHCACIVLGNSAWEVIADSSMGPGWDEVMEEVSKFTDVLEEALYT